MAEGRYAKLQREPVLQELLPNANPPVRMVRGARIRFAPGQPTGLHRHPISTCGVVTKGSFVFQVEGEAEKFLNIGDAGRRDHPPFRQRVRKGACGDCVLLSGRHVGDAGH